MVWSCCCVVVLLRCEVVGLLCCCTLCVVCCCVLCVVFCLLFVVCCCVLCVVFCLLFVVRWWCSFCVCGSLVHRVSTMEFSRSRQTHERLKKKPTRVKKRLSKQTTKGGHSSFFERNTRVKQKPCPPKRFQNDPKIHPSHKTQTLTLPGRHNAPKNNPKPTRSRNSTRQLSRPPTFPKTIQNCTQSDDWARQFSTSVGHVGSNLVTTSGPGN